VSGGAGASLTLNDAGTSAAGTYYVVVSNPTGTRTSVPATLIDDDLERADVRVPPPA